MNLPLSRKHEWPPRSRSDMLALWPYHLSHTDRRLS